MTTKANERQVGGDHYKTGGEEHWDRVHRLELDYFQGQITKYVERWKKKNGIQDLRKAQHFLDKYIELIERDAEIAKREADRMAAEPHRTPEVVMRIDQTFPQNTRGDREPPKF